MSTDNVEDSTQKEESSSKKKKANYKTIPSIHMIGKLTEIKKIYLVIGTTKYEFNSLILAIDTCFKFFLVFKFPYTYTDCPQVWNFLHKYVYEMKGSREYKGITDLCQQLNSIPS